MTKQSKLLFLFISLMSTSLLETNQSLFSYYQGIHIRPFPGFIASADYVNGGLIINYPDAWFAGTPFVNLSIELKNLAYADNRIIMPMIVDNHASSTTIRVNINDNGTISEAATDDVIVHVQAFSPQIHID